MMFPPAQYTIPLEVPSVAVERLGKVVHGNAPSPCYKSLAIYVQSKS
jgi:hypothetical protein